MQRIETTRSGSRATLPIRRMWGFRSTIGALVCFLTWAGCTWGSHRVLADIIAFVSLAETVRRALRHDLGKTE
jgi:hypothetical protein